VEFFNGREHAGILDQRISDYIYKNPVTKSLAIIMVGNDATSEKYVGIKEKLCKRLNIPIEIFKISGDFSDEAIFIQIENIFRNNEVGGGIIQLPLPRKSLNKALELIPLEKDVDLISPNAQEKYYSGNFSKLSPVVRALKYFLTENKISTNNLNSCVIGDGYLVGKPITQYLNQKGAKNTLVLDYKRNCKLDCQLLILSAGISGLVKGENIKSNCHILDYGSSVVDGKVKGDLDLESEIAHLGVISPSPGGVGPLVTRFLTMNFLGI